MNRALMAGMLFLASGSLVLSDDGERSTLDRARLVIERLVTMEAAYDPRIGYLYDERAVIRYRRTGPDGRADAVTFTGLEYREILKRTMTDARAKGDRRSYRGAQYQVAGKNVRVTAMRYSELKRTSAPVVWTIGRGSGSDWVILEEFSEIR